MNHFSMSVKTIKSKKITLLTLSLIKGGAEHQLVKLASNLKKEGNDVTIIAILPKNDFKEIIYKNKINYKLLEFKNFLSLLKILSFFKKNKPDIIVSFMYGANMIGRFIKCFTGIPLITSVRNNEIDKKFYYLYRLTYWIDSASTFNSSYSLNKFIKDNLTNKNKSFLVNNSIDVSLKKVNTIKNEKRFELLSIAHFRPQKDYKTLLKAIKILKERNINVHLNVLGHLYEQKWPFELIEEYNLNDYVDIIGFTKQTEGFLDNSDAVVLSSLWEGTPNALLEGMANKLPVISSSIPGCKELILKSQAGLLFETKNPNDLAKKIIMLLEMNKNEREELGINGYNHILNHYESNIVFKEWNKIIDFVLD